MASLVGAYFLWLCGGLFGVHHFYLKRDYQAFLWWTTLGGLGFGWLRDSWRIPDYVAELNKDKFYMEVLQTKKSYEEAYPSLWRSYGYARVLGQLLFGGLYYCTAFKAATVILTDQEHGFPAYGIQAPAFLPSLFAYVGGFIGVYMVGHTHTYIEPSWRYCLGGFVIGGIIFSGTGAVWLGTIAGNWKRQWISQPAPHKSMFRRIMRFSFAATVWLLAWTLIVFFLEFDVTDEQTKQPRTVRVRDAFIHVYRSRFWEKAWSHFKESYDKGGWNGILNSLDVSGEKHAREVLGVSRDATEKEIKSAYKKLARQWHPDRNKDPQAKSKMEEINAAHTLLINAKRGKGGKE
jgi:DnaJ family protein C protein 22|mmetsp:Transcript_84904/g.141551  ORF Transcript_84904/g.141551 Transcript_84904/m.141551 type:complete len:348 (+) Transcript_84904:136-1179(+)|eukprot:CAMPEP_0174283522 /NCGR_PEP_ID=MMETSP0809-20121228/4231_1 /TAXON_ID=73025 ORGANISM="Eutreptiella gymnastica-like, Strain CCMP1594" /NCGR_SAMPLE_ID=MMETSP0809 /ASSEMBLY_ACC=CAM_ASM_000658 /LENGTH=347 /DNA_ID=CAMNT_0015378519 /DNA_START=137 /DNA_END=1180 /DNA_ORIENTATION=-